MQNVHTQAHIFTRKYTLIQTHMHIFVNANIYIYIYIYMHCAHKSMKRKHENNHSYD